MPFSGPPQATPNQVHIPEQLFRQVLYQVHDLYELKLTLYIFWRLDRKEDSSQYLRVSDLGRDTSFIKSMGSNAKSASVAIEQALQKAVSRGTLLQAEITNLDRPEKIVCFNTPQGQALVEAVENGTWNSTENQEKSTGIPLEPPNIYQLYETHVGPLTPMIADALRDAEKTYQASWIEDAFRIAVDRNKRNWRYIEAILARWQEGGHDERKDQQDRRDTEEARRRYLDWEK